MFDVVSPKRKGIYFLYCVNINAKHLETNVYLLKFTEIERFASPPKSFQFIFFNHLKHLPPILIPLAPKNLRANCDSHSS
jgi:hypothetical protein